MHVDAAQRARNLGQRLVRRRPNVSAPTTNGG
jgi:hypothetical protein